MSKKHTILMVLCCVVGIGAILAVTAFRVPVNNVLLVGLLLLCPLSHILMMGMMGKEHNHGSEGMPDHSHHGQPPIDASSKPISSGRYMSDRE